MNPSSGATIRADLNFVVEEAATSADMPIGLRVMPAMGVDAKSGTYPKLLIEGAELLTAVSTVRQATGSYNRINRVWGTDTYDCVDRGLEELIDDANAKDVGRFFNLEAATSRLVLRNILLDHEVRVAAQIFNTTNFGSATNSVVAYTAANIATIDFAQDVLAAIKRVKDKGSKPNTIVMGETVFLRLVRSTLLQNFVRGTISGQAQTPINASTIAAAFRDFGITQCLIGDARQNTANKAQTKSLAEVWGTTHVWVGAVNSAARIPQEGGAGFTLCWNAEGGTFVTEKYRSDTQRSDVIRVRQNCVEKVTDTTAGTLIATQYS